MSWFIRVAGEAVPFEVLVLRSFPGWVAIRGDESFLARLPTRSHLIATDREVEGGYVSVFAIQPAGPDGVTPAPSGSRFAALVREPEQRATRKYHRVPVSWPIGVITEVGGLEGVTINVSPGGALVHLRPDDLARATTMAAGSRARAAIGVQGAPLWLWVDVLEVAFPKVRMQFHCRAAVESRIAAELLRHQCQQRPAGELLLPAA